jgi:lysophospholipase L1-like esterase
VPRHAHLALWIVGLVTIVTAALVAAALVRDTTGVAVPAVPPASTGPSPSPSPSAEPEVATLEDARRALRGSATLSVIGDSTGDQPGEWVELWARRLADDGRRVALHQWAVDRFQPEPVQGPADGDEITIWNASLSGGQANWANDQLDAVQPERPDLILLSVGHNNLSTNIAGQLDELQRELDRRWDGQDIPLIAILQNPGHGEHEGRQKATLDVLRTWAADQSVPTIDVTSAFTDPATQLQDGVHPNERGSQIWADTVADALIGDGPDPNG